MRILLATYFTYPSKGGQNTYMKALKNSLEKHGHQVDIFARHPVKRMYYLIENKSIHEQLLVNKKLRKLATKNRQKVESKWIHAEELERALFERWIEHLRIEQYELIHAQDVVSTLAFSRVIKGSIPLLTTIHGLYSYELMADLQFESNGLESKYAKARDQRGLAASERVIVPSHYLKKRLVDEFNLEEKKAVVVASGLDVQLSECKTNTSPNKATSFTIACPARLAYRKGHVVLLDAIELLSKKNDHFQCLIIGDGPLMSVITNYCKQKQLTKHVQFLGYRTDVDKLLASCDAVVLPTLNDNFPYTVMEGQAAGKVVIASDVGGIPEMMVDCETGLLFPVGDAGALARKLMIVMQDEQLRKSIEKNAFNYAKKHWDCDKFYKRMMNVYEQLN